MADTTPLSEVLLDYITRYGLTPKAREYLRQCAEEELHQNTSVPMGQRSLQKMVARSSSNINTRTVKSGAKIFFNILCSANSVGGRAFHPPVKNLAAARTKNSAANR